MYVPIYEAKTMQLFMQRWLCIFYVLFVSYIYDKRLYVDSD